MSRTFFLKKIFYFFSEGFLKQSPCIFIELTPVLNNWIPSTWFMSRKHPVLDYIGKRKVSKSLDCKTSLYSVPVIPQMKNCVQFINSTELSGGGNTG